MSATFASYVMYVMTDLKQNFTVTSLKFSRAGYVFILPHGYKLYLS